MEEIAAVYARSLFEVARDQDKLDAVREQLGQFTDALSETRDLQVFFFSPYFSTAEKEEGLERVVTDADPAEGADGGAAVTAQLPDFVHTKGTAFLLYPGRTMLEALSRPPP